MEPHHFSHFFKQLKRAVRFSSSFAELVDSEHQNKFFESLHLIIHSAFTYQLMAWTHSQLNRERGTEVRVVVLGTDSG